MQNPFPVNHSPNMCNKKNKTYQFVLLSHAIDSTVLVRLGLVSVSWQIFDLGLGLALSGLGLAMFWPH